MIESTKRMIGAAGVVVLLGLGVACTSAAVCEEDRDCFVDEVCEQGECLLDDETGGGGNNQGGSGNGSNDNGGGGDNGGDNGGENNNGGDDQACLGTATCRSGVEELDEGDAVMFRPGDSDSNLARYGCSISGEGEEFIAGEVQGFEAQSCPSQNHAYRIPVYNCTGYDFTLEFTLTPQEPQCGIDDWFDEVKFAVSSTPVECDPVGGITTNCFNFYEEDGVYRWVAVFNRVSSPGNRSEMWPGLDLKPVTGSSVPYEISWKIEAY